MIWHEILKARMPTRMYPQNIKDTFRFPPRTRYSDSPLWQWENGQYVNVRDWLKQLRAVMNSGYDAIIDEAKKMEDTIPMSTITGVIAPLRTLALNEFRETVRKVKDVERDTQRRIRREKGMHEADPDKPEPYDEKRVAASPKNAAILTDLLEQGYVQIKKFFLYVIPERLREEGISGEVISALLGDIRSVAPTVNPSGVKQERTIDTNTNFPELTFYGDNTDMFVVFPSYVVKFRPDVTVSSRRKTIQVKFDNSEMISPPVGLREDIDMGREGRKYIREKIMKPFDQFESKHLESIVPRKYVEEFREDVVDDPPLKVVTSAAGTRAELFFEDELQPTSIEERTEEKVRFDTWVSDAIGKEIENAVSSVYVTFRISTNGSAPFKVLKTAVDSFIMGAGKRNPRTIYVTEEGKRASAKEAVELEPEKERLTEEMQEQSGGGFYPALESYLDSTGEKLSEYKYEIIIKDRDDASDISRGFNINMGETPLFEIGYTITGQKDDRFRSIIDRVIIDSMKGRI